MTLRPQYHYFKEYSKAKEFADLKNTRARVNRWVVRANVDYGYTAYNLLSDDCPMNAEPYGESGTINQFQDRLNQIM